MPETAGSAQGGEPSDTSPPTAAEEEPVLTRRQLELPDGRYLLSYSSAPAHGDA